ncbi:uncharacterized protein HD556DRAFT_1441410 [Suillus plorans]|uniref:Uncharacterized protein n=1 Tax=Suillus plorans TaxID=116603 RepID=A0A9P7AXE8_9AGAM|nr:uncharacterized protein HD556DRAFT_1441410 [Suillus plorans]KAG1796723.1 hypothetical protein HD556DRAFT_1441410 [Suillus plorans]
MPYHIVLSSSSSSTSTATAHNYLSCKYNSCSSSFSGTAMGVNHLWEVLEPATTTVPIVSLALSDRYAEPAPHLSYVVGIDASGWFEQCQQGKWQRAHAQTGMNPALQTFLFRLAWLAQFPV